MPWTASSQTASISNVKAFSLKNIDAIVENDEVKGYLAFYLVDKKDSKENNYKLAIWDNNLIKKYDINLIRPKGTVFLESSYNGYGFCYSFFDPKEKKIDYLTYNKLGKKTGTYSVKDLSNFELMTIMQKSQSENNEFYGGLVGVPTKGFIRYGLDNDKGKLSVIELIDTAAKKVWSKTINGDDKNDCIAAMPLVNNKDIILSSIYVRESMMSQKIKKSYIKFQNAANGADIFNFNTKGDKYQYSMYGASFEGEEIYTYGEYYTPESNPFKDPSVGLFILVLDKTGKTVRESYIRWTEDIEKTLPGIMTNDKGKSVKIAMQKMVKTADNNFFVICEQYYRTADAAGIAFNVIGGSHDNAVTKIVLQNMVVLQLNSELKLIKGDVVAKEKSSVHLIAGLDFYGSSVVASYLKATGQFDYRFTNLSSDRKTFSTSYVNFDRESEDGNYVVGTISYNKDQKLVTDKIPLKDKSTSFTIMPSKPGYISIVEYFRKTKSISLRLEKLNL